jgi:DNA gyrase subunit B
LLKLALENASIVLSDGKVIDNTRLASLSDDYQTIQSIVDRLSKTMDEGALRAIANGVRLDLDTEAAANVSAEGLKGYFANLDSRLARPEIIVQKDERTERFRLMISRRVHGNTKISMLDSDFVHGADYGSLARASEALTNVLGTGAIVKRGDSEKNTKEASVKDFREAMEWLLAEAERGVSRQRYKGLGEMNPEQLWETTMDTNTRTLLKVNIEDAISADQVFTTLMGDEVEPRRQFIETNALIARNIDV